MRILNKTAVGLLTALLAFTGVTSSQAAEVVPNTTDPGPAGDFNWKGYNWAKRSWSGAPMSTGQWDKNNVSNPDANGHITMSISNPTGSSPVGAEFMTTREGGWGYGTYSTTVEKDILSMQKEIVWGCLFTYDAVAAPGYTEIDLCEASAWGGGAAYGENWDVSPTHGYWFDASKPAGEGNNTIVYAGTHDTVLTHKMVWEPGKITFETYAGEGYTGTLIKRTVLQSSTVPVPTPNTKLHYNLWTVDGGGGDSAHVDPESIKVRDFSYAPLSTTPTPVNSSIKSGADILAYDGNNELWNYGKLSTPGEPRVSIGAAGTTRPKSATVTDWNTDGIQDMVIQTAAGDMVYRQGLPNGGFSDQTIGFGGWSRYDITVGKWKTTDKYPSVIGRDTVTGDIFQYPNPTGNGFGARVKIASGFGSLNTPNLLDWDKDGKQDLVVRDSAGNLKLYRTNGAGAFVSETRATIATGYNAFNSIKAVSGHNGPGTVGLVTKDSSGNVVYRQADNKVWAAPKQIGSAFGAYLLAGN